MTHPYSIFIWQPNRGGGGSWIEPLQVYTKDYAIYVANLIHRDAKGVIKVVRYGVIQAAFPDEETVRKIDRYIEEQKQQEQS